MTSEDFPAHSAADDPQPDPSLIGGVPKAPLAFLPEPVKLFQARVGLVPDGFATQAVLARLKR